jgi:hypothetical protein
MVWPRSEDALFPPASRHQQPGMTLKRARHKIRIGAIRLKNFYINSPNSGLDVRLPRGRGEGYAERIPSNQSLNETAAWSLSGLSRPWPACLCRFRHAARSYLFLMRGDFLGTLVCPTNRRIAMTALRRRLLADVPLRGLAPNTQPCEVAAVPQRAQPSRRAPDQLSAEELRQSFLCLLKAKQGAEATCRIPL